jgi:hypothetical protein
MAPLEGIAPPIVAQTIESADEQRREIDAAAQANVPAPSPPVGEAPPPAARERAEAASQSQRAAKSRESETTTSALANVTDRPLPAAPPVIVDLQVQQPVPEATADLPRPAQAFSTARAGNGIGVDALVRREFPTVLGDATPPLGVWIVLDAGGRTLRTGTLARGESLGTVLGRLQREMPERRLRPFEITNLRNTAGAMVPVGVSRAE